MRVRTHMDGIRRRGGRPGHRIALALTAFAVAGPGIRCSSPFAPDPLVRFNDCDELLDFVAERLVHPPPPTSGLSATVGCSDEAVIGDFEPLAFTTTTTQEVDVDEGDIVKSNGQLVLVLRRGVLVVTRPLPTTNAAVLASLPLPGRPTRLFLSDPLRDAAAQRGARVWAVGTSVDGDEVQATLIDLTTPTAPAVLRQVSTRGRQLGARRVDDGLLLVTRGRASARDVELRDGPFHDDENIARVRDAGLERVLPQLTDTAADGTQTTSMAFQCDDVWAPGRTTGVDVTAVQQLSFDDPRAPITGTGVVGVVAEIYVTRQSLVLVGSERYDGGPYTEPFTVTRLHRLRAGCADADPGCSIGAGPLVHTGSAVVDGAVRAREAVDERDGTLRLVVEAARPDTVIETRLLVLDAESPTLEALGTLSGLTEGAALERARFIDDDLFVTSYPKGVDPETAEDAFGLPTTTEVPALRHFSLARPSSPRFVERLNVGSWIARVQPVDASNLVVVGVRLVAPTDGPPATALVVRSLQRDDTRFDVGPALSLPPDDNSTSDALLEPHALTVFPEERLVAVPVQRYEGNTLMSSRLVVFDLEKAAPSGEPGDQVGELVRTTIEQGDALGTNGLPLHTGPCAAVRRSVMMTTSAGRYAVAVSTAGLTIASLDDDAPPAQLPFGLRGLEDICDANGGPL